MKIISGGVTAPKGFKASGVACGLKKNGKKDLSMVYSEKTANAAGVFTTNVVKGHSLQLTMNNIKSGFADAVIINSGNANACVGEQGLLDAIKVTEICSELLKTTPDKILFGSTGVIGFPLNMEAIGKGLPLLIDSLIPDGGHLANEAILTTDLIPKEISVEFEMNGTKVTIGGMAKGSGMIHPNMATMIGVITTDLNISSNLLQKALKDCVNHSFNRVSVDGDTSVCDMVIALANGFAQNVQIIEDTEDFENFKKCLNHVCTELSKLIAKDGEGASKLIEVCVNGSPTEEDAYKIVLSVAKSPLVKTAMFGEDANWGRIFTAAGYSGANFDPEKVNIYFEDLMVCSNGVALQFDEVEAKKILSEKEVKITIDLNQGNYSDRIWTCDFSYDYIKINGSYRS